ncbi:MAG: 23S rRNA (adenine(2503)-C(2))-methyltransferase RlmN [Candidatus Kapaibacteriota bacterium]
MENILEVLNEKAVEKVAVKKSVYDLSLAEWIKFTESLGEKKFRAEQVFIELYKNRRQSISELKTLPKSIITAIDENFTFDVFKSTKKQVSVDGSVKFLFTLKDNKAIESVYMPWMEDDSDKPVRETLCISSQVGCAVDCSFCATGKLGFMRNLSIAEIVMQVLEVEKQLQTKITNIVFMGMGEPLLNYKNVVESIRIFTNDKVDFIRPKRITVSTSGVVPKMYKLADENLSVKLALSLHSTTNGVRDKIIPINKSNDLSKIMEAIDYYYHKSKLPITYEYIPFAGLNDTEIDAKRLAKISKRLPSRINLIPFNDISFTNPQGYAAELKPTNKEGIAEFVKNIRKYGGTVTVRDTFGSDIDAACGQLALSEKMGN